MLLHTKGVDELGDKNLGGVICKFGSLSSWEWHLIESPTFQSGQGQFFNLRGHQRGERQQNCQKIVENQAALTNPLSQGKKMFQKQMMFATCADGEW